MVSLQPFAMKEGEIVGRRVRELVLAECEHLPPVSLSRPRRLDFSVIKLSSISMLKALIANDYSCCYGWCRHHIQHHDSLIIWETTKKHFQSSKKSINFTFVLEYSYCSIIYMHTEPIVRHWRILWSGLDIKWWRDFDNDSFQVKLSSTKAQCAMGTTEQLSLAFAPFVLVVCCAVRGASLEVLQRRHEFVLCRVQPSRGSVHTSRRTRGLILVHKFSATQAALQLLVS